MMIDAASDQTDAVRTGPGQTLRTKAGNPAKRDTASDANRHYLQYPHIPLKKCMPATTLSSDRPKVDSSEGPRLIPERVPLAYFHVEEDRRA
jgi:hypothetical protein